MNLDDNTRELIIAIITVIVGGSFLTYKLTKKSSKNSGNKINQNNNKIGKGDIVAGNKKIVK